MGGQHANSLNRGVREVPGLDILLMDLSRRIMVLIEVSGMGKASINFSQREIVLI